MAHWYKVFDGVHVTFGAVRGPQEVINDPQLGRMTSSFRSTVPAAS